MLALRLPASLEKRLDRLVHKTGRTKSYYARKAIEEYIEDREDYLLAVARLEEKNPSISLEELEKKLGLENKNRQKSRKRSIKIKRTGSA